MANIHYHRSTTVPPNVGSKQPRGTCTQKKIEIEQIAKKPREVC